MARHNAYIRPRVRKQKEPFYLTEEKRISMVLSIIQANAKILDYDIQKIMKWGPGVHERVMRTIKNNYQDVVEWNKKTRMWKYIGKSTQDIPALEEIPIKEKPELSDNELDMIHAIKQESHQ